MLYIKYLIIIVILLLNQNTNAYADKIVYLNMEKIMKQSKAGKFIIEKINKSNETNLKKFSKIEEDLKKEEVDLIGKKNVLSAEEFQKRLNLLKKKINE